LFPTDPSVRTCAVSLVNMTDSSVPTAKLQETKTTEPDPAKAGKAPAQQAPAMLEEDDEFEDFPVEGMSPSQGSALTGEADKWS
jgi:hypothetical protein